MIETRNGSDWVLTQHLWGPMYVDELLQIAINGDPGTDNDCLETGASDASYYALQDANYNVLAIVASDGDLAERYEYTPYGQRTIFKSPGSNDLLCHAAILESQRVTADSSEATYGLCDIGHQGLMHDKEFGLIYNRARYLHSRHGRFMQQDPLGYVDGMSLYEYVGSGPVSRRDALGLKWKRYDRNPDHWCATSMADRLQDLAASYGSKDSWTCLWPIGDTTDFMYKHGMVLPGDKYDAGNLSARFAGTRTLYLTMDDGGFDPKNERTTFGEYYSTLRSRQGKVVKSAILGVFVDSALANTSGQGRTPISLLELAGHSPARKPAISGGSDVEQWILKFLKPRAPHLPWNKLRGYYPKDFSPDKPEPTFDRAKSRRGPRRCWFTRTARVRAVVCNGHRFGVAFAKLFLREGASLTTTLPDVRVSFGANVFAESGVFTHFKVEDPKTKEDKTIRDPDNLTDAFSGRHWRYTATIGGRL